ncbi:AAA family ATPase [bacterium]|nr:AAA family ATPase [bacterium]
MPVYHPIRGREKVVDLLVEAWREAAEGCTRLVIISGDPGTGKTRLLQELYHWLHDKGGGEGYWPENFGAEEVSATCIPRVPQEGDILGEIPYFWWGVRCLPENKSDEDSVVPFSNHRDQLWAHLVAPALVRQQINTDRAWQRLLKNVFSPIAGSLLTAMGLGPLAAGLKGFTSAITLDSQLSGRLGELDRSARGLDSSTSAQDLGESISSVLAASQAQHDSVVPKVPLILALDDIQWLDRGSRILLRRLCEKACSDGWALLVVCTVRSNEEPKEIPEVKQALRRSSEADPVLEIKLDEEVLSDDAAEEILRDRLTYRVWLDDGSHSDPIEPDQQALARLRGRAGNNALYVVNYAELVVEKGWLDEQGALTATDAELQAIPKEIEQVIDERLELLGEGSLKHDILSWGSSQGIRFCCDLAVLACRTHYAVAGEAESKLARALDQLVLHHNLIRRIEFPGGQLFYEFTHQLHHQQTRLRFEERQEACQVARDRLGEMLRQMLMGGSLEHWPAPDQLIAWRILCEYALGRKGRAGESDGTGGNGGIQGWETGP